MALSTSKPNDDRSFSDGIYKKQLLKFTVASGDTSGVVTFDRLSSIDFVMVSGVVQTAQPTFSGNQATLAFVDPVATIVGQLIAFGK